MEELDFVSYCRLNESFDRRMVCRIGVDCGFFIEMNFMVNAMLFCLAHRIKFQIYSADANFGTGVGWTEYFLPFCEEVQESFHQRYNFHRLPSWPCILKMCRRQRTWRPVAWKVKSGLKTIAGRIAAYRAYGQYVLLAQDVSAKLPQMYCIPELGIDGDYTDTFALVARMVWRLRPELLKQKKTYRKKISLPPSFSGVQIRGGDKISETPLVDGKNIIRKLGLHNGDCLFILTDDYRQFLKAKEVFPQLRLFTLCQEYERGYYHKQFCQQDIQSKKMAISRLIISVDLLLSCNSLVGSITTGPSVFVMKLRCRDTRVQAVDCPKDHLPAVLQLPIAARSVISIGNL